MTTYAPSQTRWSPGAEREAIEGILYLSPWIIGFLLFIAGPLVASLYLSFTKYNVLRPAQFIGFENFIVALTKDDLSGLRLAHFLLCALNRAALDARLADRSRSCSTKSCGGTTFWRTFYFLPTLTPILAVALLWRWMLNPDVGLINYLLEQVGIEGPGWLSSTTWAIPSLVLMGLWNSVGGSRMIIFLAGLQDVPQEVLESAEIDGANSWTKFWYVTLPLISPTIFFNLVLGILFALRTFDVALIATNGGPARATWFISLHIYQNAFVSFDMGYASALSLALYYSFYLDLSPVPLFG